MVFLNSWLILSLMFLGVWFIIWIARGKLRKEMLWASILTTPFGLTEPLFVPEYWNPPSLFNLAANTGFDIESFIFAFAVGGVGSVLYEFLTRKWHKKISKHEKHKRRHRFHLLVLISPFVVLILLYLFTNLNPIYSVIISLFIGGFAAILCRPDLKNKVFIGGLSFLILYFFFFLLLNTVYPGWVKQIWNLAAISGILIMGVPLEELIFAFTFGMMWSSYYEHINWYK